MSTQNKCYEIKAMKRPQSPQTKRIRSFKTSINPVPLEFEVIDATAISVEDNQRELKGLSGEIERKLILQNKNTNNNNNENSNDNDNKNNEIDDEDDLAEKQHKLFSHNVGFKLTLKFQRDPIVEALKEIGPKTFNFKELFETLEDLVDYNLKKSKSSGQKLHDQLVNHDGVCIIGGDQAFVGGQTEYSATDFLQGDQNFCSVCNQKGTLLCCDGCPDLFHKECVNLAEIPDDDVDWYCQECVKNGCENDESRLVYSREERKECV